MKTLLTQSKISTIDTADLRIKILELAEDLMIRKKITSREAVENFVALFMIMMAQATDSNFLVSLLLALKAFFVVS